jgi:hypothetical protein
VLSITKYRKYKINNYRKFNCFETVLEVKLVSTKRVNLCKLLYVLSKGV